MNSICTQLFMLCFALKHVRYAVTYALSTLMDSYITFNVQILLFNLRIKLRDINLSLHNSLISSLLIHFLVKVWGDYEFKYLKDPNYIFSGYMFGICFQTDQLFIFIPLALSKLYHVIKLMKQYNFITWLTRLKFAFNRIIVGRKCFRLCYLTFFHIAQIFYASRLMLLITV